MTIMNTSTPSSNINSQLRSKYCSTTGELVYLSDQFDSNSSPSLSLSTPVTSAPPLPDGLHNFLQEEEDVRKTSSRQLRTIKLARITNRKRRNLRITLLDAQNLHAKTLASQNLLSFLTFSAKKTAVLDSLVKVLTSRLTTLSLLFYKVVESEKRLCVRRLIYENHVLDKLAVEHDLSQRLALFSLHIEHETSGSIVLKKLPSAHPQYMRCSRAAAENAKQDFFTTSLSPYSGVEVQEVYKIENRILLSSFQACASAPASASDFVSKAEAGKVKGLFCTVPVDCLESLIVYGMNGRSKDGTALQHAFQDTWYDVQQRASESEGGSSGDGGKNNGEGYAKKAVDKSNAITFPRCFSRHSTLEEDRVFVNTPIAEGERSESEGKSGVRYLALCRVMIGKIFVTSKNSRTYPPVTDSSYDSMYSPVQEEYKLMNGEYVLPEFLVQYRFKEREKGVGRVATNDDEQVEANLNLKMNVFEIDLSNPTVELPVFETRKEHKDNLSIVAFPLLPHSANTSRGQGGLTPPDLKENVNDDRWLTRRQNATTQKAIIMKAVGELFIDFYRVYDTEKAKVFRD